MISFSKDPRGPRLLCTGSKSRIEYSMFIIRKYFEHDEWEEYRGEYQEAVLLSRILGEVNVRF